MSFFEILFFLVLFLVNVKGWDDFICILMFVGKLFVLFLVEKCLVEIEVEGCESLVWFVIFDE